ncbi:MAG: PorV/PorQ family protein [candidate division FCPU426 bacterium]
MVPQRLSLALALSLLLAASSARAGSGVTGATLMAERTGARASGMGEAYSALGEDLGVVFYNPAGLAPVKRPLATFLHYSAIALVNIDYFGYEHPFSFGPMAASLLVRGQPDINNPLAQDNPVSANDILVCVSYAQRPSYFFKDLPERFVPLEMGVNLKYMRSHLGTFDSDAVAVDLGARYPQDEATTLALSLLNLGPPVHFVATSDPLPITAILGGARRFEFGSNVLNLAGDLEYPIFEDIRMHFGVEDWVSKSLALRVGYILEPSQNLGGLTAGFSVKLDQEDLSFGFDYAFKPAYYDSFSSFEPQHLLAMNLGF